MHLDSEVRRTDECRDELSNTLVSGPRRQIALTLLNAPEGRGLPLPDAAITPAISKDSERYLIELQRSHPPKLAEAGDVQWSDDPFCVRRGPRFDEPAAVFRTPSASRDQLPSSLWNESVEPFVVGK